jgi:septum site-determining protein MinC
MALVLAPEPPVAAWVAELDRQIQRSPAFFAARPVVVDVSALPARTPDLSALIDDLRARDVRIVGVESGDPSWLGVEVGGLPPITSPARPGRAIEVPDPPASDGVAAAKPQTASLLLDEPIRSGQSVVFPPGDVTVVGSVASGAEIIAGGSIHVYGWLRGRAIAGSMGNARARIFCRRMEAELLAIDGLYKTADGMEPGFRGRAVQAWLEGDALVMAALD